MSDLLDTVAGFTGAIVFAFLYQHAPFMAFGMAGFHVGVVSMRMSRGYFAKTSH